ncbi:MAG: ribosome small subunit-dependent GTPase A [Bacilli bacterium]|jgi:ribosome biogenesis GTPase|nr:ribosome small subunit-dependent GTPase A [Bacilli bacterium]
MRGLVIKLISGDYTVRTSNKDFICKGRGVFRHIDQEIIVGDLVEIDINTNTIINVLPRKNRLARPSVSNVDKVFLVFSVQEPDLNLNLLDRLISYYEYLGLEIIIIFTKLDLLSSNKYENIINYYQSLGYKIFKTSIYESNKIEILKEFDNSISVLSGQSGVGKSSLLNAIGQDLNIKTDKISYALNRGKHTTRHVELLDISKGLVADTPGFGTIDFEDIDEVTLSHTFVEFFKLSAKCKFNGCLHINEPGCAVIKAYNEKNILQSRYSNYLGFIKEIKELKKNKY